MDVFPWYWKSAVVVWLKDHDCRETQTELLLKLNECRRFTGAKVPAADCSVNVSHWDLKLFSEFSVAHHRWLYFPSVRPDSRQTGSSISWCQPSEPWTNHSRSSVSIPPPLPQQGPAQTLLHGGKYKLKLQYYSTVNQPVQWNYKTCVRVCASHQSPACLYYLLFSPYYTDTNHCTICLYVSQHAKTMLQSKIEFLIFLMNHKTSKPVD